MAIDDVKVEEGHIEDVDDSEPEVEQGQSADAPAAGGEWTFSAFVVDVDNRIA